MSLLKSKIILLAYVCCTLFLPHTSIAELNIDALHQQCSALPILDERMPAAIHAFFDYDAMDKNDKACKQLIKFSLETPDTFYYSARLRHRPMAKGVIGLLQKGHNRGSLKATTALADIYLSGWNTEQNVAQGMALLHEAAVQGDPYAQLELSVKYSIGDHVEKDHKKSITLLESAAARGYPLATYYLGFTYYYGEQNIPADQEKGIQLWRQAAQQGVRAAKESLAKINVRTDDIADPSYAQRIMYDTNIARNPVWRRP